MQETLHLQLILSQRQQPNYEMKNPSPSPCSSVTFRALCLPVQWELGRPPSWAGTGQVQGRPRGGPGEAWLTWLPAALTGKAAVALQGRHSLPQGCCDTMQDRNSCSSQLTQVNFIKCILKSLWLKAVHIFFSIKENYVYGYVHTDTSIPLTASPMEILFYFWLQMWTV